MTIQQQVINKVNQGQEADVHPYTWQSIPKGLRIFWINYFRQQKQLKS